MFYHSKIDLLNKRNTKVNDFVQKSQNMTDLHFTHVCTDGLLLICDEALTDTTKINHNHIDLFDDVNEIDHVM